MARNGGQQRGAGSLQCSERFHPSAHRRRQGQIEHLSAVVDSVVSARRIVGELRAWRSGAGHLSARIERCDQYVCGRQERGALYSCACAGGRSIRFVKIGRMGKTRILIDFLFLNSGRTERGSRTWPTEDTTQFTEAPKTYLCLPQVKPT